MTTAINNIALFLQNMSTTYYQAASQGQVKYPHISKSHSYKTPYLAVL
jgi:hypothetical protein